MVVVIEEPLSCTFTTPFFENTTTMSSHCAYYAGTTFLLLSSLALLVVTRTSLAFSPSSSFIHHPTTYYHQQQPTRIISTSTSTSTISKTTTTALDAAGSSSSFDTKFMWNAGLNFGKGDFKFYNGFDQWMSVFPDEDRQAFPELFNLPVGVYEVQLSKPLGIVFEELDADTKGLYVKELVPGGSAEQDGIVKVGDHLVAITAVKIVGAKYERRLIPCRGFDFDTMVGAVESNDPKWSCDTVILMVERPDEADPQAVDAFLEFFTPPFDNPWRQRQ